MLLRNLPSLSIEGISSFAVILSSEVLLYCSDRMQLPFAPPDTATLGSPQPQHAFGEYKAAGM